MSKVLIEIAPLQKLFTTTTTLHSFNISYKIAAETTNTAQACVNLPLCLTPKTTMCIHACLHVPVLDSACNITAVTAANAQEKTAHTPTVKADGPTVEDQSHILFGMNVRLLPHNQACVDTYVPMYVVCQSHPGALAIPSNVTSANTQSTHSHKAKHQSQPCTDSTRNTQTT